jgi:hypothetical protein
MVISSVVWFFDFYKNCLFWVFKKLEFLRTVRFWLFTIFHFREPAGSGGLRVKHQVLWGQFSDRKPTGFETVSLIPHLFKLMWWSKAIFYFLPRFLLWFIVGFLR